MKNTNDIVPIQLHDQARTARDQKKNSNAKNIVKNDKYKDKNALLIFILEEQ
ncbi:hypothetical protein [Enterococcus avium]|uniref:hypothetical protein n=1 Tax=Enterococcus avium TaxID=33945 RepID=UPI002E163935